MSGRKRRKFLRKQLGYLGRNLRSISELSQKIPLLCLTKKQYKNLLVIHEVYRQQKIMFEGRLRRIDDRIVSISQPHIRPIKRGKAGRETEFGAKISVSLVDGVAFVDHLSWDNFNEGGDLSSQVEAYRRRFGYWPKSIHADKLYRNRDNLKFCKKHGIRLSGPPLGRPPKETAENTMLIQQQKAIAKQDEIDRIPIEGKFGQGKRRYGLGLIMSKRPETSACSIVMSFLVMNLMKWLKVIFYTLLFGLSVKRESIMMVCSRPERQFGSVLMTWKVGVCQTAKSG
jgi:IS5 family transposase